MELTDIDGVGPARSDSLVDAGYDSVELLAMSDADEVAEDVDIPEDTALEFVVQAQNMVADSESDSEASDDDAEDSEEEDDPMPADLAEPAEESESDDSEDADASDEEEVEDEESVEEEEAVEEVYSLTVDLETDAHYDAYMTALYNAYERRVGSNQNALDAINHALDEARYNSGEVSHELTAFELNTLHASVSQQVNDYKGKNMIDEMDAMRDLLAQINEVRQAELF